MVHCEEAMKGKMTELESLMVGDGIGSATQLWGNVEILLMGSAWGFRFFHFVSSRPVYHLSWSGLH